MLSINKMLLILALFSLILVGCSDKADDNFVPVNELTVSPDFDWQASRQVELDLRVLTNTSAPVQNVVFEIFTSAPEANSTPVSKGSTDSEGKMLVSINVPSQISKLWAVGYMSTIEMPIVNNRAAYTFGGAAAQYAAGGNYSAPTNKNWSYLPGWTFNSQGLPSPKTTTPLEAGFLSRVDATLPERMSVPQYHPHYLENGNQTNLKIDEQAQVWITFVHEGAGHKNALGFHTFPSNQVPQTTAQVGSKTILLPNASLNNSGGQLTAGDTFYLGIFDPGTTLGWFLVSNGFQNGSNVSTSSPVYYSTNHLNPESDPAKKQHSIMVFDDVSQRLLIGFEDLPRMSGSDDDFNDLVFFVTVNPIEAVDLEDVPSMDIPIDRDGDGISDRFDDYPDDPELAFNNYTFGANAWGSLAFEDLWPNKGDYDFNDMVVDYNYNQITRAGNLVKKIEMNFKLKAVGARNANGFAVELPFASSNISNVQASKPALFNHETDGAKSVMRFFNNTFDLIPQQPSSFINTEIGKPYFEPVSFGVSFKLINPVAISGVTPVPPYNPFIFVNGVRGHEVHLPGFTPTSKANMNLFGTGDDASLPNNWYKTSNNLPWAVNIPQSWDYPIEKTQITRAYLKFKHWAQSSGLQYTDWFASSLGYRDNTVIYQRP